jgi:hypothetical protein
MTQPTEKKKRTPVALPTSIDRGDTHLLLSGLSLTELAELQAQWKQKLADVPRIALELRAINAAIRKCASGR